MKKLILFASLALLTIVGYAQNNSSWDWASNSGTSAASPGNGILDVVADAAGNIYAVGQFNSAITIGAFSLPTPVGNDIFIAKYNSSGTIQWLKKHSPPTGFNEISRTIAVDIEGNVYIGGADDTPNLSGVSFLAKYDTGGSLIWNKYFSLYAVNGVNVASDGNLVIMESNQSNKNIHKINKADGSIIWTVQNINAGSNSASSYKDFTDQAGNIYYTCFTTSATTVTIAGHNITTTGTTSFIASLNQAGQMRWVQPVTNIQIQLGYTVDANGKSYIIFSGGGGGTFQGYATTTTANRYFELDNNGVVTKNALVSPYAAIKSMFRVKSNAVYSFYIEQGGAARTISYGDYIFKIPSTNTTAIGINIKYDLTNGQVTWANSFEITGGASNSGSVNILEIAPANRIVVAGTLGTSAKFGTTNLTSTGANSTNTDLYVAQFNTLNIAPPAVTNWTGSANNGSWTDANNWDNGVPDGNKKTFIASGLTSYPTTVPSNATPAKLEIATGAKVQLPLNFSSPAGLINNGAIEINETGSFIGTFGGGNTTPTGSGKIVIKNSGLAFYFTYPINQSIEIDFTGTGSTYGGTINGDLILTKGILTLPFELYPLVATNIIGGSATSFVAGKLLRKTNASGNYFFPIGTADRYAPINLQLNNVGGPQTIAASFSKTMNGSTPNTSVGGKMVTSLLNAGIWTVTPDIPLTAGSYNINLNGTGYTNGVADAANYVVLKRANSSGTWAFFGDNGTATQTGGVVSAKAGNITGFSDFAIGIASGAVPSTLPIQLISFTARADGSAAVLNWQTASELNNEKFEVQRSVDGIKFDKIGDVKGSGTVNTLKNYSYRDNNPKNGNNYYRLKQIDLDGKYSYTEEKVLRFALQDGLTVIKIYPNPVVNSFGISGNAQPITFITLNDALGRKVLEKKNPTGEIDISNQLSGVYFLTIIYADGKITQHKLIKR